MRLVDFCRRFGRLVRSHGLPLPGFGYWIHTIRSARCFRVPSPLAGEGQGGGCLMAHAAMPRSLLAAASRNHITNFARSNYGYVRVRRLPPPPSLALPRKGGGNAPVSAARAPASGRDTKGSARGNEKTLGIRTSEFRTPAPSLFSRISCGKPLARRRTFAEAASGPATE
jgi:hypothetical protein